MAYVDLVLSSGFLAFSRHVGFLRAVEEVEVEVGAVVGTSSGALVAALWWSGMKLDDITRLLTMFRPLARVGWNPMFWQGPLTMAPVIDQLRAALPSTFEGLAKPFAVGVTDDTGSYRLLTSGPLPEAVAASCAVPRLFRPVSITDRVFIDGGAVDSVGLKAWRAWRGPDRQAWVHEIAPRYGEGHPPTEGCTFVRSPGASASFLSLGDFDRQADETRRHAVAALRATQSTSTSQ